MTLERVLEPEVMDSWEEAQDYDEMDHSAVNTLFADDFLATGFERGDILDLGTGTAQIPIAICRRHSDCRIMAADMAVNMLEIAKYNIDRDGMLQRIQLSHMDAKKLRFSDEMFDAVISNSIVHHIPEPAPVIAEAIRVTRPGGILFFRDLLRPETTAELERLVEAYAGKENAHAQKMFAESLHAALTLNEFRAIVKAAGYADDTVVQSSDRHWTWSARKPAIDSEQG
jgi:ubiquinone/menaquinone biosynthesis C-methylase UbiE